MIERPARPPLPFLFRLGNLGIRVALALMRVRIHVEGVEHVPDEPGVIVASNHLSIVDPPLVCVVVARLVGRRTRYMAKAEALDAPILGLVLRAYGGFGVRRGRPDREAYRMARSVLDAGEWLGVAPGGGRSRRAAPAGGAGRGRAALAGRRAPATLRDDGHGALRAALPAVGDAHGRRAGGRRAGRSPWGTPGEQRGTHASHRRPAAGGLPRPLRIGSPQALRRRGARTRRGSGRSPTR